MNKINEIIDNVKKSLKENKKEIDFKELWFELRDSVDKNTVITMDGMVIRKVKENDQ